jgi:hypothetical protein
MSAGRKVGYAGSKFGGQNREDTRYQIVCGVAADYRKSLGAGTPILNVAGASSK